MFIFQSTINFTQIYYCKILTLFSIKINSLAKVLSEYIEGFLYVDDFLICYRGKNMNNIERQLQTCLNKIKKLAIFNKTVLSAPQSVLDTNFKILRALRLLFLSILIWGRKVSLLSKMRPKNCVSGTIFIGELYNFNSGSGRSPLLLQMCIPTVFALRVLSM
jgi:hypothetical protein